MVPAVERGRVENVVQPAKAHLDITMGQKADVCGQSPEPENDIPGSTGQRKDWRGKNDAFKRVDEVKSARVEKPELL